MANSNTTEERNRATEQNIEKARATAQDVANQAKDATAQMKDKAAETAEQVRQKTADVAADAKQKVESVASNQKAKAADRMEGIASALRQTSQELKNQEEENVAHYTDAAAEQVERMSGYLRTHDVSDLLSEVNRFAKQQPELFIAGSLAAGFFLGRFLRSSSSSTQEQEYQRRYQSQQDYMSRGYRDRRAPYVDTDYGASAQLTE